MTQRLNVRKPKSSATANQLAEDHQSQLADIYSGEHGEDNWATFKDSVYSATIVLLGTKTRKNQDWFDKNDGEIKVLLEEKHRLHRTYQNDLSSASKRAAFTNICSIVQANLRKMQDSWLNKKAEKIQTYTDKHDSKRFLCSQGSVWTSVQ